MFERLFRKREARKDAINKAREGFVSWLEVSKSIGWKAYEEKISKEVENIKEQMFNNVLLSGDDLKHLQLALQVWKKVLLIPNKLKDGAKGGIK